MRIFTFVVVLIGLIAACSDADSSDSATTEGPAAETTAAPTDEGSQPPDSNTTATPASDTASASSETDVLEVSDDVLTYLANVEELLAGTAYEDAVAEDPEIFVATGFLFCDQLAGGEAPADVLRVYIETLTDGDIEDAGDDDVTLAGTILGTAVGQLCPEHATAIEQGF